MYYKEKYMKIPFSINNNEIKGQILNFKKKSLEINAKKIKMNTNN
jgi:hypothetical protein